jgi:WD40 repeat protein
MQRYLGVDLHSHTVAHATGWKRVHRVSILLILAANFSNLRAAETPVNFEEHVKPILRQHCLKCHGDDKQESDLNMQTYEALLRGGSGGNVVEAGRSGQSVLFEAITNKDADGRMPPNSPPLPQEKIELIRKWIDTGLLQTTNSKSMLKSRNLTFTPAPDNEAAGPTPLPSDLPPIVVKPTRRPFPVLAMDVSPRAPLIAASAWEFIRLIHSETEEEIGRLAFPEGEPHVIRFSRDGKVLMVAGGRPVESGRIVLFDVRTGKRLAELGDELDAVLAADIAPDQRFAALGGSSRVVKVYSTTTGKLQYKLTKHTDWITSIAFSPDGTKLATSDRAGSIHLWDAKSGGILLNLAGHKEAVRALDWRGDSRMLASTSEDGKIIWWDVLDGFPAINKDNAHPPKRPAGTYGTIPNGVLAARFDRHGNLVTAGRDQTVRMWAPDGQQTKAFLLNSGMPISNVVSADGSVVSGDSFGVVRFWPKED